VIDSFFGGGPRIKVTKGTLWNRTGQPLTPGELVPFNLDFANTSGQNMVGLNPSDSSDPTVTSTTTGYILGSAVVPTATNIKYEMAVVDDTADGQDVPDNAPFTAVFTHPDFPILLEGSSGIGAGEYFRGTSAAYYGTGLTRIEVGTATTAGEASVFRLIGQAMEAGGSGSAARKRCRFWGGLPCVIGTMVGIGAS